MREIPRTTLRATWDIRGLIRLLGGDAHVSRMLERYGFNPAPADTIQAWKARGSLPASRLADLFALAGEMGIATDLNTFLKVTKT